MIAPFLDTAQVIKILEYHVHPSHAVDPRDEAHTTHNVAIAKLACRYLYLLKSCKRYSYTCILGWSKQKGNLAQLKTIINTDDIQHYFLYI